MAKVIKLRKGLDINLTGKAREEKEVLPLSDEYGLVPDDFPGLSPKVAVHEGDKVRAGDVLFVNKKFPDVKFSSPVSGTVTAVVRRLRRKVFCVKVKADREQEYVDFGKKDPSALSASEVIQSLLDAGLFGYINQLPYAISTEPGTQPKAVFISALRDKPLAGSFSFELKGNQSAFQAGVSALAKIAKVYVGIGRQQTEPALTGLKDAEVNVFDGPCPAGNVGVQVNHLAPVNKGEVVWTVDATAVIFFGRLFLDGRVDLRRTVAVAGSEISLPHYVETLVGTPLADIVGKELRRKEHVRLLNGNPLTGRAATLEDFLGAHTSEVTAIPEGDDQHEVLGWIRPRLNQFSASRSYFSWLFPHRSYDLDARVKGGRRHLIMSGEYDRVLPMDIYGGYLIKAIIAGDIDRQEQLGIYEVAPEDFAVAEFVDSSKLPLQEIVRKGLDTLRKENA